MLNILAKLFIKNSDDLHSLEVRKNYGLLCGGLGLFFNILLFAIKLFAAIISGSMAAIADAFNNLSDALSSIVALFGFKLAVQKADKDHPFGHGRVEYISGFIVSMLILLMGAELLKSSIKKIFTPVLITYDFKVLIILVISILIKFYMFLYNKKIGKKIHSATLFAISKDSIFDVFATSAVLLSMLLSKYTSLNIDAYCGAFVAVFILYSGIIAAKDAASPLLGQAPNPEMVKKIEEIVLSHDKILGMHDLIIHDYGHGRKMISLHAEVSAESDLCEMHDIIDQIETILQTALNCDAVIHIDPLEFEDKETLKTKQALEEILKEIDPSLGYHDFRLIKGNKHNTIIFDLVVPYDFSLENDELLIDIDNKIKQNIGNNYFSSIKIDNL